MVEIALCLGVIAFALVAIIGVLPTGVRVQRDNREDTIINQEGLLWLEAIRSGAQGLDYLTNYVDTITISNITLPPAITYYNPAGYVPPPAPNTDLKPGLTNGQVIVGLLTFPRYLYDRSGKKMDTNYITARVRAISGSASDKGQTQAARDFAFAYRLTSEVVPLSVTPEEFLDTNNISDQALLATRLYLRRLELNRGTNFHDLRLQLQGPLIPRGKGYDVVGTPKTFRTLISGFHRTNEFLIWPSTFVQAP